MNIEYSNELNRHEAPIPDGCPPEFRRRIMEIRASRTGEKRNVKAERTATDARRKAEDMRLLNSMSLHEIAYGRKAENTNADLKALAARQKIEMITDRKFMTALYEGCVIDRSPEGLRRRLEEAGREIRAEQTAIAEKELDRQLGGQWSAV